MKTGMTNDDIKMRIESKCTNMECFPIENCTSYQHNTQPEDELKYIILNFKKYYDDDDNLVVNPNICFDIEEGDIYTINLTIIPNNEDTDSEHVYTYNTDAHIMKYNEFFYNLKLKASREFCSMIKTKHGNNAFNCVEYRKNPKYRMGIRESLDAGILEEYPILYSKDKLPVYHKKFTIIVNNNKTFMLKYQ
jgi:methionine aminopeptidase